ncbi:MAG: hypothetical protein E4H36_09845 [Spirochaetales bacterium]|nr:MAG: hypothetical protein E4H36_09845 [Spirochaetales bacterium]
MKPVVTGIFRTRGFPPAFLKFTFFLVLIFSARFAYSQSLAEWLTGMKQVHPVYKRALLDREIADLNRKKNLIEASTEEQKLGAEITYISALSALTVQYKTFYEDVADAAFTVALEGTDLEIAEVRFKIASDSYNRAKVQYQQGLVSAESVEGQRIASVEAEKELLQARETRNDAARYFTYTTGLEWKPYVTDLFTLFSWLPDKDTWHKADFPLQKARIQHALAGYRLDHLPANAPPGEKRISEISLEQAVLTEKAAEFDADRTFARNLLDIKSLKETAEILSRKLDLEVTQTAGTRLRFQQGAVSEQEYDQKRVTTLQAERNSLAAILEFTIALFDAVVLSGFLPEDVL